MTYAQDLTKSTEQSENSNTNKENNMNRATTREFINEFISGTFEDPSTRTQIAAGWYDWFCKDTSLAAKTKKMGNIIKKLKDGGKVNLDKTYVWFKNNCPLHGALYDDFRIADLETGDVQFTIQIDCCWNKSKYAAYGRTPDGQGHWEHPLFETNSQKELVEWLNAPWEKK